MNGYKSMYKIFNENQSGEKVIQEIINSGLRGRGGGGFPTGLKWRLTADNISSEKFIICNADEGDPHSVLEGMTIAAYAVGANTGVIYCRAEYPLALKRIEIAIEQSRKRGYLGKNIFCKEGFDFDITIKEGAGAFVCGEETALIASIEGQRGMPRKRPPFPASQGLWKKPTRKIWYTQK
ncbi:MAG: NADP-reducing hydrogenase subunit HndC [Syntrophomonadaceae bacterium]|nr:NADP-reducing hydrogenase subunit HndC [Bacillota bacterium]